MAGIESGRIAAADDGVDPAGLHLHLETFGAEYRGRQALVARDEDHEKESGDDPADLVIAGGVADVGLLGEEEPIDAAALHLLAEAADAALELVTGAVGEEAGAFLLGDLECVGHRGTSFHHGANNVNNVQ